MTGAAAGQVDQGATGQEPLKAAPTDKEWLRDMESIRGSAPPPDTRVVRLVDDDAYRSRTEER